MLFTANVRRLNGCSKSCPSTSLHSFSFTFICNIQFIVRRISVKKAQLFTVTVGQDFVKYIVLLNGVLFVEEIRLSKTKMVGDLSSFTHVLVGSKHELSKGLVTGETSLLFETKFQLVDSWHSTKGT